MCVAFLLNLSVLSRPHLIVLSNRDEYLRRPSMPVHVWGEGPLEACPASAEAAPVLAGRDAEAGGTWFGVNPGKRRFAVVTNWREPNDNGPAKARSRGELVSRYLYGESASAKAFANAAVREGAHYRGFNLVVGTWEVSRGAVAADAWLASNRGTTAAAGSAEPWPLDGGADGEARAVSNGDASDDAPPWPKCRRGLRRARTLLERMADNMTDLVSVARALIGEVLWDAAVPDVETDGPRPNTGVPEEWEEQLRAVFVDAVKAEYGTRSNQALLVAPDGSGVLVERHWDADRTNGDTLHPSPRGGSWRWVEHKFDAGGHTTRLTQEPSSLV